MALNFTIQDGPAGAERVWCTTINGIVLQFNSHTLEELSRFDLNLYIKGCMVVSMLVVNNTLWYDL